jgi:hypothetical protein
MRFGGDGRTVGSVHQSFREELLRQREDDLARRLRTAYQLRGLDGSHQVEQRRLRRRALGGRWSGALTALRLPPGAERTA